MKQDSRFAGKLARVVAWLPLALTPLTGVAQQADVTLVDGRDDWLEGELFIAPTYTQNATSVPEGSDEEKVGEEQLESGLSINAQQHSVQTLARVNYSASRYQYLDDSQADRTLADGDSEFRLGATHAFARIEALHSIRRILNSASTSAIDLANSQNREIYAISPIVQTRLGSANRLQAKATHQQVLFSEAEQRDSKRNIAELSYTRLVSPIYSASIIVQHHDVQFSERDDADYENQTVYLQWLGQHRRYWYQLRVGRTELKRDAETTSGDSYTLASGAEIARSQLTLFATQSISDSTLGNQNDEMFSGGIDFDGDNRVFDLMKRKTAGVQWSNGWLCERCRLDASASIEDVDYLNFSDQNFKESTVSVSLAYDFSRFVRVSAFNRASEIDFDNEALTADTSRSFWGAELQYRFQTSAIALRHERRKTDSQRQSEVKSAETQLRLSWYF